MEDKIKLYIVDDEKPIVMTLQKLITKVFPTSEINVYYDGLTAWQALQEEKDQCVIISDLNMPGLNGLQFLKKVRTNPELKGTYFIVITSSVDAETNIKTLQQGADDFLSKPFSVDQLIVKMRAALRMVNLIKKEKNFDNILNQYKEEQVKDAEAMRQYLIRFQKIRMPESTKHLDHIVQSSVWIAKQLCETEEEIEDIRKAAEICFCGKLFLSDKLVELPVMVKGLTPYKIMYDIPSYSRELLKSIRNSEKLDKILYYIYENLDGSGFPEKKKSWEIPLGSRILRVTIEFEELLKKNMDNVSKTIELMLVESKRLYDHRVVAYYDQFLGSKEIPTELGKKGREYTIGLNELEDGMTIARNIITDSGLFLIAPNIRLNEEKIERIKTMNKSDKIIGKIYVRNI